MYEILKKIRINDYINVDIDLCDKNGFHISSLYENKKLLCDTCRNEKSIKCLNYWDVYSGPNKNNYFYNHPICKKCRNIIPNILVLKLKGMCLLKNIKFRINVPEAVFRKMLKIIYILPSVDNIYYYFEGKYAVFPDSINMLLPKNILRISPRQMMRKKTALNHLFKNTKYIDKLILDNWRDMTDISFLENIKINSLQIIHCSKIETLIPLKNCGIKDMFKINIITY